MKLSSIYNIYECKKPSQKLGLIFFIVSFFIIPNLSFAAAPSIGTISPSNGTTLPNVAKAFTCTYLDTDGWANINQVYLLISTSTTALANSCYLYYNQNTNLLYLRNNANAVWLGGFAPGSPNVIENSQVRLNCSSTTVSGSSSTLTVRWNITFKPIYSGKIYKTYLKVVDDTAAIAGFTQKGTYTVNRTPTVGIITPYSGTGQANVAQAFTTSYIDPDGWWSIQYVHLLINSAINGANCFYGYYNQNLNKLYIRNDAGNTWLGGYAPASANTIENSYVKLNCASTTVQGNGTTLTVNWSVTIKPSFTGTKNTYLYVKDDANAYNGWIKKGTWTIPNSLPQVGTISPSFGSFTQNEIINFTSTYTDLDSWLNIQYALLLINNIVSGTNCPYAYYDQNLNKLYLRNDAGTSWLGGYAPTSANTIENSYVRLYCANTTVQGSGNTLTINWAFSFKAAFAGFKNGYLRVTDDTNSTTAWVDKIDSYVFHKPLLAQE